MTTKGMSLSYALICDDVRQENSGKYIFIGVYGSSIILHSTPANIKLTAVLQFDFAKVGVYSIELEIMRNGKRVALFEGTMNAPTIGSSLSNIPFDLTDINTAGELSIRFREVGSRWKSVLSLPVTISE